MSTNRSFWQDKAGVPGVIRESPIPTKLADSELLIKVGAWALNPADFMIQDTPLPFITYPLVLGEDVAGTVELVGSAAASKFKVGDRILGCALGSATFQPREGGFQDYVVLDQIMACKMPDSLSFVDASVFPLCITTAAIGLFSKDYLSMPFPKANSASNGKAVFVWGGSSGVGSNAIQLSKAAGFEVITTCSAGNFEYVKGLGADEVFDYKSLSAIEDVAAELDKRSCVGIFHAAGEVDPSCQVARKSKQRLFVASATLVPEGAAPEGVVAKMIFGNDVGVEFYRETTPATFGEFLPDALSQGRYKVAPTPEVVPIKGIEGIQGALDILKKGVSAKKIVIKAK